MSNTTVSGLGVKTSNCGSCSQIYLQPAQQVVASVMRLGGSARGLVRSITPDEIMNGGVFNGIPVDPVTYVVHGLQQRFALLDDEHRLAAMTQLLAFPDDMEKLSTALLHDMKSCDSEQPGKVTSL